jgi:hypothetical protein
MSKPTFYDEQQAEIVKQAIAYLATDRGQFAINRLAQGDAELHRAVTVTADHKIPWHNLGLPGWADICERVVEGATSNPRSVTEPK